MTQAYLDSPAAGPLSVKEASGDSFEALKVLIENASAMAQRLKTEFSEEVANELFVAQRHFSDALNSVNTCEGLALKEDRGGYRFLQPGESHRRSREDVPYGTTMGPQPEDVWTDERVEEVRKELLELAQQIGDDAAVRKIAQKYDVPEDRIWNELADMRDRVGGYRLFQPGERPPTSGGGGYRFLQPGETAS